MRRTIEIKNYDSVYYNGRYVGTLSCRLAESFGLERGKKYRITICAVAGGKYQVFRDSQYKGVYNIWVGNKIRDVGFICAKQFEKLFFRLDGRKRYNITIEEVTR